MKCISSPALDDTQIIAFVEGEADAAVVSHIGECQYCREKARGWTHLQNHLRKQSYRVTCPTPMQLGEYHLGYLPAPDLLVVSQHLRECILCSREVAALENFLTSLAPASGLMGTAKVLIARLVGASSENSFGPAAPALRGEAKGPLTFEADGIVIVLDIQPVMEGRVDVLGQVAADDQEKWTGALVEVRQGAELQASTTVDDLGTFRAGELRSGPQELRIIPKDHSLIIVSSFEVLAS
jgi:hypothetical protein